MQRTGKIARLPLHECHRLWNGAIEQRAAVRWQVECDEPEWQEEKAVMNEAHAQVTQPIWNAQKRTAMLKALGGGADAEKAADFMIKMANDYTPLRYIVPRVFKRIQGNSSHFKPPLPPQTTLNFSPSASSRSPRPPRSSSHSTK